MHPAKVLLTLLTKGFPPPEGGKHAFVCHENKMTLVVMLDDGIIHITLEDEDLERTPSDIFEDVTNLIAAHRQERQGQKAH